MWGFARICKVKWWCIGVGEQLCVLDLFAASSLVGVGHTIVIDFTQVSGSHVYFGSIPCMVCCDMVYCVILALDWSVGNKAVPPRPIKNMKDFQSNASSPDSNLQEAQLAQKREANLPSRSNILHVMIVMQWNCSATFKRLLVYYYWEHHHHPPTHSPHSGRIPYLGDGGQATQ